MSRRNRDKRRKRRVAVAKEDPSKYYSDWRDAFYGGLLGASAAGLASAALSGNWAVLAVFGGGLALAFLLLFGINVRTKPIRFGVPFRRGLAVGTLAFGLLALALRLLG